MNDQKGTWKKPKPYNRGNVNNNYGLMTNMIPTPKINTGKCYNTQLLTHLVVEISLHPCVTSDRSFNVVPTYTKARVIGWQKNKYD